MPAGYASQTGYQYDSISRVAGQRELAPTSKFSNDGGFKKSVFKGMFLKFYTTTPFLPSNALIFKLLEVRVEWASGAASGVAQNQRSPDRGDHARFRRSRSPPPPPPPFIPIDPKGSQRDPKGDPNRSQRISQGDPNRFQRRSQKHNWRCGNAAVSAGKDSSIPKSITYSCIYRNYIVGWRVCQGVKTRSVVLYGEDTALVLDTPSALGATTG